jgi:hypothetical protein
LNYYTGKGNSFDLNKKSPDSIQQSSNLSTAQESRKNEGLGYNNNATTSQQILQSAGSTIYQK